MADLLTGQEKQCHHRALGGEARQATLSRNGLGSARLTGDGPRLANPKAVQKRHHRT